MLELSTVSPASGCLALLLHTSSDSELITFQRSRSQPRGRNRQDQAVTTVRSEFAEQNAGAPDRPLGAIRQGFPEEETEKKPGNP